MGVKLCPDLAILVTMTDGQTKLITLPLAHGREVNYD